MEVLQIDSLHFASEEMTRNRRTKRQKSFLVALLVHSFRLCLAGRKKSGEERKFVACCSFALCLLRSKEVLRGRLAALESRRRTGQLCLMLVEVFGVESMEAEVGQRSPCQTHRSLLLSALARPNLTCLAPMDI